MTGQELAPIEVESMHMVLYGGTLVPEHHSNQCTVCMNPFKKEVESRILDGDSYAQAIRILPEEHSLSKDAVRRHWLNHTSEEAVRTRQIVEDEAQRVGKDIDAAPGTLVNGISLTKVVVQRTFEMMARGEIKPTLRDGLRAVKVLADLGEYDTGTADQQAYADAFRAYQDEAEKLMGEEVFRQFGQALEANPILRALVAKYVEGRELAVEG